MDSKINIYKDVKDLSKGFTEFILTLLEVKPLVNISLSGGNTPKAIFDYWAENCKNIIPWERIAFFWGDERCVPPSDSMSNYGMTYEHLFSKISSIPNNNIYRIYGENEPEEEAQLYGHLLEQKIPLKNNIPCFDLVMLGLGDDGHTASIFPNQTELWDEKKNCVVAEHPVSKMKRISLTGQVINNASNVAFLVTGKEKAQKVKEIVNQREDFYSKYPAARVNPNNGKLYWFMDNEAANELI